MIGEPGEGWRAGHDRRQPRARAGRARLRRPLPQDGEGARRRRCAPSPTRYGAEQVRDLGWAIVEAEMLRLHVCRRLSDRLDGISHGPEGSVDKLLMTSVEQAVGHAALSRRRRRPRRRRRHVAEGVPLQPGPERHGRHVADPAQPRSPAASWGCPRHERPTTSPTSIEVEADGPIRIVRLNRPEQLNATNHELHQRPGRAVPADRRRPRRPGRGAHRQRPGLLGRRRLRLHRRARPSDADLRQRDARRTAGRSSPAWWRAGCRSSPR